VQSENVIMEASSGFNFQPVLRDTKRCEIRKIETSRYGKSSWKQATVV
jgi:hypothetical protein